jgi:hypothetical protein
MPVASSPGHFLAALLAALAGLCLSVSPMLADDQSSVPQRPAIMFNRWQEDWSVLADSRVPRQPFDELKYIPLSDTDRYTYLSFGAGTRDRFEPNNAANSVLAQTSPKIMLSAETLRCRPCA